MPNSSAWGIEERYRDDSGQWHEVSDATKNNFLTAMQATQEGPGDAALMVVRQGSDVNVSEPCELQFEDGHFWFSATGRDARQNSVNGTREQDVM